MQQIEKIINILWKPQVTGLIQIGKAQIRQKEKNKGEYNSKTDHCKDP